MEKINYSQIIDIIKKANFVIVDKNIFDLYPLISESLAFKNYVLIENPEQSKSLSVFESIINQFLQKGITRTDTIYAIGGGAVSDLAGFIASSILRGVKWEVIPTTLLAQIDAAIGGKVGVNTDLGKNLIGGFHLPENIYICEHFLSTLSREELNSGKGELLKYAFLDRRVYFLLKEKGFCPEVIYLCGQVKKIITSNDFKENGKRKVLNLGHTLGHSIEKTLSIPHGIAVYCGLEMIIKLYCPELLDELHLLKKKIGLDYVLPKMNRAQFDEFVKNDKKKVTIDEVELIIPVRMGEVKIQKYTFTKIFDDVNRSLSEYFL